MKTRFLLICLSVFFAVLPRIQAQDEPSSLRSPEELDQLFGPIALYPDALIALILPASTVSSDVVMAARYLRGNGDPARVEAESWDDSVKSLSHYPEVVKWMDEDLAWTKQAGEAFVAQPADVMNAIQRLRTAARAAGTLVDTPQQRVVMEDDEIAIIPADPEVIYVPRYDPEVVYVSRPGYYHDPFLTFGAGFATGIWLGYDFDWGRHRLWTIDRRDRERYWRDRREHGWSHHDWHGSPRVVPGPSHPRIVDDNRYHHQEWQPRREFHRPAHVSGGVVRPDYNRNDNSPRRGPDQRGDGHRNDPNRDNDGRRPQHRPDGTNSDGRGRPGVSNTNTPPRTQNATISPPAQAPVSSPPASASAAMNPGVATQPTPVQSRQSHDRADRGNREARGSDRANTPQNPQGRVMQLQPNVQPRPANAPTVVNREARAPQSPPTAHVRPSSPPQPPPQQAAVSSPPRTAQPPQPSSRPDNNGGDRRGRDDHRDRGPRS